MYATAVRTEVDPSPQSVCCRQSRFQKLLYVPTIAFVSSTCTASPAADTDTLAFCQINVEDRPMISVDSVGPSTSILNRLTCWKLIPLNNRASGRTSSVSISNTCSRRAKT
jgi:hypothetical protein